MATIRQRSSGSWEVIIRRKGVLDKPHYASADTEAQATAYAERIESALDKGILPDELIDYRIAATGTVSDLARDYLRKVHISEADRAILNAMLPVFDKWSLSTLNIRWAETWVSSMKKVDKLSPTTIQHKVGAVARLFDWSLRSELIADNPLRRLPKRYSSYTPDDGAKIEAVERDRRLEPGEYERILFILDGGKPEGRQRGIYSDDREALKVLFILSVETAMRMREMYTLSTQQIDMSKKTIFLDKTKNGDKRQVPLSSVAIQVLSDWISINKGSDLIFPWWNGDTSNSVLRQTTTRISRKWGTIASMSGCDGLRFHDLRHEACCRLYERTNLTDLQIAKITGHKSLGMLRRYSNLRGSDLADALW